MGIRYHLFFRVLLGFTAIIITFMVLGAYIFTVWRSVNADVETLDHIFETTTSKGLEELDTSLHLALELEESLRLIQVYLHTGDDVLSELEASFNNFDSHYADLSASFGAAEAASSASTAGDLAPLAATLDEIEAEHERLEEDLTAIIAMVESGEIGSAHDKWNNEVTNETYSVTVGLEQFEEAIENRVQEGFIAFDDIIHSFEARIRFLQTVVLIVLSLGVLSAFAIGYFTAKTFSAPIEQLSEAAVAVERGDFDPEGIAAVTARRDELGRFARIFARMAAQVEKREQQLRAHISALRIEIDRQKSNEELAEITDTEFFRDLQTKAQAIRAAKPRKKT